jgi:hypothetical protein
MSFAEQWAKDFIAEYKLQKIDDWWNKLTNQPDSAWTYRIAELLRALSNKMGFQMEYDISTDFSWYKQGVMHPHIAIEHENTYSDEVYKDELPKLLASGAQLKVLITYVKQGSENCLVNRIQESYRKPCVECELETRQATEEFLLLLDDPEGSKANWRAYIFFPNGKLKHI